MSDQAILPACEERADRSRPPRFGPSFVPKHQLHERIARVLALELAVAGKASWHGVVWFSIDHGLSAALTAGELFALGVAPGQPDIFIFNRGNAYMLWVKAESGMLSDAQQSFTASASAAGVRCGVVRDVAGALVCLDEWQIPRARRVRRAA